mgnify:FL=1
MILAMGFGFVLTYLLGSLNFAVIVSRLLYHDDVRNYGSGNAGMTNMLRTYGKKAAFLTGLGDFFKGTLSVVLARAIIGAAALQLPFWSVLAAAFTASLETGLPFDGGWVGAIGVLLGHLFPIFFHFKGGKGILAACGAILLINPDLFVVLFVVFVPIAFITRIVSLASVLGASAYPFLVYIKCRLIGRPPMLDVSFALVCVALILYMHRENIKRLLNGTEKKIGRPGK